MTDHSSLNRIQQLCTDLESRDPELVLGHVYGLRQWQLHAPTGQTYLAGHFSHHWQLDGPNEATCGRSVEWQYITLSFPVQTAVSFEALLDYEINSFFARFPTCTSVAVTLPTVPGQFPNSAHIVHNPALEDQLVLRNEKSIPWKVVPDGDVWRVNTHPTVSNYLDVRLSGSTPIGPHKVTLPSCQCGFYAYTDRESLIRNSRNYGDVVFGIIRGSGLVTQGSRGFRAERAEIVALTRPHKSTGSSPFAVYNNDLTVKSWLPNSDELVNQAYDRLVPDRIAQANTLNELLDLYELIREQ
jgi:hypothetical protein